MNIRKFTDDDYPSIANIHNSLNIVWPAWPKDPETWIGIDRNRDPKCHFQRWVAEEDGKVVGASSFGNHLGDYHPQKFFINIEVLEPYRRRGIGAALYDRVMLEMQAFDPLILLTDILENQIQSYPFVQKRGFKEVWRETPVHLDVAGFDGSFYANYEENLMGKGISFQSLRDLENDPDRNRKVYNLYIELSKNVTSELSQYTPIPFEDWVKMLLGDPTTEPDAFTIAVKGDEYIALHDLAVVSDGQELLGGLLGTLPAFRKQHIGLILLVKAIMFAQQRKIPVFKTCTGITNAPMQTLFKKLGFACDPEWLQCEKLISR